MDGLVYFSTLRHCGHARRALREARAATARSRSTRCTGKLGLVVPRRQYSPVVADEERVYLVGPEAGSTGSPVRALIRAR